MGSTARSRELGDRRWWELLDVHDDAARRRVEQAGGQMIKNTGDGVLATFDGPGRAIRAAESLRDDLRSIGLEVRAGLHTGEVEERGTGVGSMAVHLAARVMSEAGRGQIVVARTVRDLVVGSDLQFEDLGIRSLTGVEGDRELVAVASS